MFLPPFAPPPSSSISHWLNCFHTADGKKRCHHPLFIFIGTKPTHLIAPLFSTTNTTLLSFSVVGPPFQKNQNYQAGGGGGGGGWRGVCRGGCDWKIGSLFEWLAFTLMNLIWMEVHIKPHRFCTVILLIATEASLFVVLTPIQLKSHLEGNRLGSVNFMWKTPRD